MCKWFSKKSVVLALACIGCVLALLAVQQTRNRSGAQLKNTIALVPIGIAASEVDGLLGAHPDRTAREVGVLVNSVTMLAATNEKAKEYGPLKEYEIRVWERGAVKGAVVINGDGHVAGHYVWK